TTLSVIVEPPLAQCSAWYELFPRSCSAHPHTHGTFKDCMAWLPRIAAMGFDIVYLPPIHPIGSSFRKGKNNRLKATRKDPGSPWAIGSNEGGHTSIHPLLGTEEEFEALVDTAKECGMQIAMDLAFQCSPDHPYIKEHPDWFSYLPDGTIKHAENPPKKYEDIVPFNFDTDHYMALWQELLHICLYWIDKGIRCFRVDNPHTKPFAFWQWLIERVKEKYPEVIFLSEAFTRPKVMDWLAKIGFSQSYTYFTWRYTKKELIKYVSEITEKEVSEYFRPNFWPNTPDILPYDLQYYGQPAFMTRLILAATLSSNYGVYGPPFEQMVRDATGDVEEYANAEKYEIKFWDHSRPNSICDLMTKLNTIRRLHEALQKTNNITFYETGNSQLLYYTKSGPELLLIVVNLDPVHTQSARIPVPYESEQSYRVHELLEDHHYIWEEKTVEVTIDPRVLPARIYKILTPLARETKFEYYM
ncbi:MAG: alpha-1,4-glucan--maltose-1-phosphate maltosyltransferase, partial [Verrucomicrobia bacterium]|nr:alpha-1,4-glucan--maltose-1-phosphate maltosyltransferase [Verrucomicrobiota bacterium]